MMKDVEVCFKCNCPTVCAEHTPDNLWRIHCVNCHVTTEKCTSHDKARKAWDKMAEENKK